MAKKIPATTLRMINMAMEKGTEGVYDLLCKAYNDGKNKGRDEATNQIFTFNPEEDYQ